MLHNFLALWRFPFIYDLSLAAIILTLHLGCKFSYMPYLLIIKKSTIIWSLLWMRLLFLLLMIRWVRTVMQLIWVVACRCSFLTIAKASVTYKWKIAPLIVDKCSSTQALELASAPVFTINFKSHLISFTQPPPPGALHTLFSRPSTYLPAWGVGGSYLLFRSSWRILSSHLCRWHVGLVR